jgi:hypothetical protein
MDAQKKIAEVAGIERQQQRDKRTSLTQVTQPEEVRECPRCRFNLLERTLKAAEPEKEEYLRAVLGGRLYIKEYVLYDGKIRLQFSSLKNKAGEELSTILRMIERKESNQFVTDALKVKLLYYLVKYNKNEFKVPEDVATLDEANELFKTRFGEYSEDQLTLFLRTLIEFQNLLALLAQAGFDENFWKGAGLV